MDVRVDPHLPTQRQARRVNTRGGHPVYSGSRPPHHVRRLSSHSRVMLADSLAPFARQSVSQVGDARCSARCTMSANRRRLPPNHTLSRVLTAMPSSCPASSHGPRRPLDDRRLAVRSSGPPDLSIHTCEPLQTRFFLPVRDGPACSSISRPRCACPTPGSGILFCCHFVEGRVCECRAPCGRASSLSDWSQSP